jgi:hypothetical protein
MERARSASNWSTAARKTYGHGKPPEAWDVLIRDHHAAYIDWAEYQRNQMLLAANAYGRAGGQKSGRGGRAFLPAC